MAIIIYNLFSSNKLITKKYQTVPKANGKIVETGPRLISLQHITSLALQ
jgi:hypothetical protein